jgi:hypothetical protein
MKLYKLIHFQPFIFLCFYFVSNLSFAQFNELRDPVHDPRELPIDPIPTRPLLRVGISGNIRVDTKINNQITYTIQASTFNFFTGSLGRVQIASGTWSVGNNGRVISSTNNSLVVSWYEVPTSEERINEIISFVGTTNLGQPIASTTIIDIYTSRLTGETNITIPNNRIQTYKIEHGYPFPYVTNNNSWSIENGEVISYGNDSITIQWNTSGTGRVTCNTSTALGVASYSNQVNITSTSTGNETMFTYDTSGNQKSAKLD